jgi:hypothetical protein
MAEVGLLPFARIALEVSGAGGADLFLLHGLL